MTAPSAAMRAAEEIVGLPYGSNAEIDAQILHVSGIIARHARHCPEAPDAAQRVIDARDAYWRVVSGSHTREICDARWEDLDGAIDTLRAALAASPAGEAWQPIETAPKDGTAINLYRPRPDMGVWYQRITAAWYVFEDGGGAWVWPSEPALDGWWESLPDLIDSGDYYEDVGGFTHWQPLPAPPAEAGR